MGCPLVSGTPGRRPGSCSRGVSAPGRVSDQLTASGSQVADSVRTVWEHTFVTTREQGDIGERSAMEWLGSVGAYVAIPIGHSPDWDVIAELAGRLLRVQVKTSTQFRN